MSICNRIIIDAKIVRMENYGLYVNRKWAKVILKSCFILLSPTLTHWRWHAAYRTYKIYFTFLSFKHARFTTEVSRDSAPKFSHQILYRVPLSSTSVQNSYENEFRNVSRVQQQTTRTRRMERGWLDFRRLKGTGQISGSLFIKKLGTERT